MVIHVKVVRQTQLIEELLKYGMDIYESIEHTERWTLCDSAKSIANRSNGQSV